jgi:hypothetical protein
LIALAIVFYSFGKNPKQREKHGVFQEHSLTSYDSGYTISKNSGDTFVLEDFGGFQP